MSKIFNVYCDESCHLENDGHHVMVMGAVWCPVNEIREVSMRIKEIKLRHNLKTDFEVKWTKISPAKEQFYVDVLDYFLDNDDLHFRAVVIPDKSRLEHKRFSQTHDDWYYKMYFILLNGILDPEESYRIYLDIKDTRSEDKIKHLHDILCSGLRDFDRRIVARMQSIRSHESALLQIADLLIGAIGYANRNTETSASKRAFVERLRTRTHYHLTRSTLARERKLNIFVWHPKEAE